jgi:hypothetical protein
LLLFFAADLPADFEDAPFAFVPLALALRDFDDLLLWTFAAAPSPSTESGDRVSASSDAAAGGAPPGWVAPIASSGLAPPACRSRSS